MIWLGVLGDPASAVQIQACRRELSVTTGTVFAFRKVSFEFILARLWFSVKSVKGKSALQLSRELGVQYKPA